MIRQFYYIVTFFLLSCNNSREGELNSNEKIYERVELWIGSPSGRCTYNVIFEKDGQSEIMFSKSNLGSDSIFKNNSKFFITKEADIKAIQQLILNIDRSELINGDQYSDGWHYKVLLEEHKKIDIFKKEDSKDVEILYNLIDRYSPIKIDFSCF